MKKTKMMMAMVNVMAVLGVTAAEMKAAQPLFQGNGYEYKAFNRYVNLKLTAGGKLQINGTRVYATCKGADGKNNGLMEKADPKYQWKDNVLSQDSFLIPRNAKDGNAEPYAQVNRKISFSPDQINVEITIKALKDLTFPQTWQVYSEIASIPTASVVGMRIDGVLKDDQKISTVIPRKYDPKKWGFNKSVKKLTLTDSEKINMTVIAVPNCSMNFVNYGGKQCELGVRPIIRQTELAQKAGQEIKFGYRIEFAKPE